jgi:hypothetical protein
MKMKVGTPAVAPRKGFAAKAKARAKSPSEVAASHPLSLGAASRAEQLKHRESVLANKNQRAEK